MLTRLDFELLGSRYLPALASQSAGITGMSHHAQLFSFVHLEMASHSVSQAAVQWRDISKACPSVLPWRARGACGSRTLHGLRKKEPSSHLRLVAKW